MSDFNYAAYSSDGGGLIDASDGYANSGFVISFYHLMSKKTLKFKAYITNFNESYASNFASEPVFGRADPIYAYRNTERRIALTFRAPAASTGEAYENLAKAQALVQFLYPAYTDANNSLTISQTPLTRLKIMNLINNHSGSQGAMGSTYQKTEGGQKTSKTELYSSYKNSGTALDSSHGLLGAITNVTIMHNLESDDAGVLEIGAGTILPKLLEIQLDFAPIHEHTLGWIEQDAETGFAAPSFPYGAGLYEHDVTVGSGGEETPGKCNDPEQECVEQGEQPIDTAAQQELESQENLD